MVKRILGLLSYDGAYFNGFQTQLSKDSVQDEVERVLSKILNKEVRIAASGRTDKGVHAHGQTFIFDIDKEVDLFKLQGSVNALLSKHVRLLALYFVSNSFHPRYNALKKHYRYRIYNGAILSVFDVDRVTLIKDEIDVSKLKATLNLFIGQHNFFNFTSKEEDKNHYVRTIFNIEVKNTNSYIDIDLYGDGFMRYMIRMIIGTSLQVTLGKEEESYILERLDHEEKNKTMYNSEASGLYLMEVYY